MAPVKSVHDTITNGAVILLIRLTIAGDLLPRRSFPIH
jgi:hypothetical protein